MHLGVLIDSMYNNSSKCASQNANKIILFFMLTLVIKHLTEVFLLAKPKEVSSIWETSFTG